MVPQFENIIDKKSSISYKQNSLGVLIGESFKWKQRRISDSDTSKICNWIKNRRLLQFVSSDDAECLTPSILQKWLNCAIDNVVIVDATNGRLAGFCTISSFEIEYPPAKFIEICHLIVNPYYRYLSIGPRLCKIAKEKARMLGFSQLFGRVVPQNHFGLALARREHFSELPSVPDWLPSEFRWFKYNFTNFNL